MTKKGIIEEIISKAKFADKPELYKIFYRDFDSIRELPLPDFIEKSENFETIPITRIELIKKNDKILFRKKRNE
jgi:hypothetical protein